MEDFFHWYRQQPEAWRERPWLVLGKGPSFARFRGAEVSGFNTFGLNHVVLETKLDVAHIIDLDVLDGCADALYGNASVVLLPWIPHVDNMPGTLSLDEITSQHPVLARLASEGRLLWYNKAGSAPHGTSPSVRVKYFSAEAPYSLLGMAGVKTIRSLGIDGGASYANCFGGLPTLLANGRESFDVQFREIARAINAYGIDAAPLDMESPVRIFVAAMEEQLLAVRVLEYSIRKHASMAVDVVPMHATGNAIPRPREASNWPRTPFSFQRFLIPQLMNYAGRAIYLDSDMQVFSDIRELWGMDMRGNQLLSVTPEPGAGRKRQYSVMLLDCAKLSWKVEDIVRSLDAGDYSYEELMEEMVVATRQDACIPAEWNSLEKYLPERTKLLHYTDMDTQPWVFAGHSLGFLWVRDLFDAIDSGLVRLEEVLDHVQKGWVRPSLAYQVEHRIEDPLLLPASVLSLDRNYSPPYYKLRRQKGVMPRRFWRLLNTMARRAWELPMAQSCRRSVNSVLRR